MAVALELKRDVNLNYSILDVKTAIRNVCNNSGGKVMLKNENDLMNTFTLQLLGGLLVFVPITIQLKQISEKETNFSLVTTSTSNTPNQSNEIIDNFLNNISKVLSGDVSDLSNKKGCVILLPFLIPFFAYSSAKNIMIEWLRS
jgi:hypothetical protein